MIEINFTNLIPQNQKDQMKLSDFKIIKIIGEGH